MQAQRPQPPPLSHPPLRGGGVHEIEISPLRPIGVTGDASACADHAHAPLARGFSIGVVGFSIGVAGFSIGVVGRRGGVAGFSISVVGFSIGVAGFSIGDADRESRVTPIENPATPPCMA